MSLSFAAEMDKLMPHTLPLRNIVLLCNNSNLNFEDLFEPCKYTSMRLHVPLQATAS